LPGFKDEKPPYDPGDVDEECREQRPLPGFKGCPLVPFFCMGGVEWGQRAMMSVSQQGLTLVTP